jgi:ABC-type transporter Mla MlaB component
MALDAPRTLELAVQGPIDRSDLPGLARRVCALLEASTAEIAVCDVRGVEPDAVTVDALARLQLAARRQRCRVILRNASEELIDLVAFMGLEDVLATMPRGEQAGRTAGTPARCPGRT